LCLSIGFPVILSWSKQVITGSDNSNMTRFVTGTGGGVGVIMLLFLPFYLQVRILLGCFGIIIPIFLLKWRKYND
jgi:hypothetical protein